MATISKNWASASTIMNANTLVNNIEEYTSDVDLETNGYEATHVTVDITFGATVEFGVYVSIYGSLDGTNYDDVALFKQVVTLEASATKQISLIIKDVAHFRIGVVQGGTVTNDATVTIIEQSWNYDST